MELVQENTWIDTTLKQGTSSGGVFPICFTMHSAPSQYKTSILTSTSDMVQDSQLSLANNEVGFRGAVAKVVNYLKETASNYAVDDVESAYFWSQRMDRREDFTVRDVPKVDFYSPSIQVFNDRKEITLCSPMADLSWLAEFYKAAKDAKTSSDIYPLILGVSDLFNMKDYRSVDNILSTAPLGKLSVTAMVALIRTTYPARSKLSHWEEAREAIRSKLASIGENHQSLLRGLD